MSRPLIGLVLLLALGCKPAEIDAEPPDRGSILEGNATAGAVLGPVHLPGGTSLSAWTVNAHGVAVAGPDFELTVDGATTSLSTDPSGMAEWIPPGPGRYEVDAGAGAVPVFSHEGTWPPGSLDEAYALSREVIGTASVGAAAIAALDGGTIVRIDPDTGVWPVAQVSGTLRAVKAVALDDDGLRDDLMVLTDTRILLAASAEDGRFVWRTGLQAEGTAFRGADVGDLDDDGLAELVIAVGEKVDWWDLDGGSLTWAGRYPLDRPLEDVGVTVSPDADVVTVLADVGWVRLQFVNGELLDVGPEEPEGFENTRLLARGADVDGDGTEELVLYPRAGRDARGQVLIASLGADGQQTTTERTYAESGVTLSDVDGDGAEDIVTVGSGGTVKRLGFVATGPREWTLGKVPAGPVAIAGADGASLGRMIVAQGGLARVYLAGRNDTSPWRPDDRPRTLLSTLISERLLTWDDGVEASGSFAAVVPDDDVRVLRTYVWEAADQGGVDPRGGTRLDADEAVLDLEVCGDQVLMLTNDRLLRVAIADDGKQSVAAERADVPGTAVACATDGDTFLGVVLSSGSLSFVDGDLLETGTEAASGAVDVALGVDTLGNAVPETCTAAGCRIQSVGSVGGKPAFVSWGADALSITDIDGAALGGLQGDVQGVTVADVDGDGDGDVIATDAAGLVRVLRRAGEAFDDEVRHRHAFSAWAGPVAASDFDGDGSAEMIGLDDKGAVFLWYTRD